MRILLYGMQSSGASLVAFFLGQMPRSVAVVDLWTKYLMPPLDTVDPVDVVAKGVVTTAYDYEEHERSFRPDRSILVLRDPAQNYVALRRKRYRDHHGSIDEKFEKLERVFTGPSRFDLTLLYEDFVRRPAYTLRALRNAGVPAVPYFYQFPRTVEEIREFNERQSAWCKENFGKAWKFGNIQGNGLRAQSLFKHVPRAIDRRVRQLCPTVCAYYDEYYAARVSPLLLRQQALWHDVLVPQSRRYVRRLKDLLAHSGS